MSSTSVKPLLRAAILLLCTTFFDVLSTAEVIYDNTLFPLSGYATERREYGDQLDLEGTGRTLTEITYSYFGDFTATGDESMKVRLYSNETPYDMYRNMPTRLLYESGNMPMNSGYNTRTIKNLNVKIPLDTVTFAIEFNGILTNEIAGLLLYGPPTVGASFNEMWGRTPNGGWQSFRYSSTDFTRRANAAIKLVARSEAAVVAQQTNSAISMPFRRNSGTARLAQTFTPSVSGRLDAVQVSLNSTGIVEIAVFDTDGGEPGRNVLCKKVVTNTASATMSAPFYNEAVYLKTGAKYAVEVREVGDTPVEGLGILCSTNNAYAGGELWVLESVSDQWQQASLAINSPAIDAAFSIAIVPAEPPVRITSPNPGAIIPYGTKVRIGTELKLPSISTVWRVRFFDGDQELEQVTQKPYEVLWKATNSGPHTIKVICEDTFGRPFRAEPHLVTVLESTAPAVRTAEIERKEDGSVTLRFDSVTNKPIKIQYTDDFVHWKSAVPDAVGTGAKVSYVDDGPPGTERHPKDSQQRFYRLIFGE